MYVGNKQQFWGSGYNKWEHSSIGMSSFYALYGQECRIPVSFTNFNSKIWSLNQNQIIQKLHSVLECVKQYM